MISASMASADGSVTVYTAVLRSVDGTVIDFNPSLFEAYDAAGSDMLADGMKQSDMWSPFTAVVMVLIVNEGELAVGVKLEDAALRYVEGAGPVQIVYPSEGTAIAPDAMALVAGAPNGDNAKAFLDFMMSQEVQVVVAFGRGEFCRLRQCVGRREPRPPCRGVARHGA